MTSIDIYSILASKPHNPHYLKRYIKFIENCEKSNSIKSKEELGKTNNHHICPKAQDLFPEYASFKEYSFNSIILTVRQHFIAHWMLMKTYGGGQYNAFFRFSHPRASNASVIKSSKLYEKVKIESMIHTSTKTKEWHSNNKHPRGYLGYRRTEKWKLVASIAASGENNSMFGKIRLDLAASNKDPILRKLRGSSSRLTNLNKSMRALGFKTDEQFTSYCYEINSNSLTVNEIHATLNNPSRGVSALRNALNRLNVGYRILTKDESNKLRGSSISAFYKSKSPEFKSRTAIHSKRDSHHKM